MPKFEFTTCPHCAQRIIRRGTRVINPHGTTIDHRLSCTGQSQAPSDEKSAGFSTSTQGEA